MRSIQKYIRHAAAVVIAASVLLADLSVQTSAANAVGGYTAACATEVSVGAATTNAGGRYSKPYGGLQGATNPRSVPVSSSPDPMARVSNATACTTPWTVTAPVQDAYFSFPALPQGMSYADGNSQITIELDGMLANSAGWYFYPLNRNATSASRTSFTVGYVNSTSPYLVQDSSGNTFSRTLTFTATAQQVTDMNNGYLTILVADAGSPQNVGVDTVGSLKVRRYYSSTPSHVVTFEANDGSGTVASQWANSSTPLSINTFSRAGYVFAGWATTPQASSVTYQDGDTFAFTADTTLYAVWTGGSSGGSTNPNPASNSNSGTLAATGFASSPLLGYAGMLGLSMLILGGVIVAARRAPKK